MKALICALAIAATLIAPAVQAKEDEKKPAPTTQYVDVSPVALPVIIDGVVRNYVFVSARINLTPSANSGKLREKEPYFRDAMVRAAHRTPFNKPGDLNHLDEAKIAASLLNNAGVICGPGAVKDVKIVSQTPKTWLTAEKPQ
jgi:hypothetical protein